MHKRPRSEESSPVDSDESNESLKKKSGDEDIILCMTEQREFKLSDDSIHCSQNNFRGHDLLMNRAETVFKGDEKENRRLLEAELAVFSGNILRLILGEPHPKYFLCRDKEFVYEGFGSHPFYRVCEIIPGYRNWEDVVQVDDETCDLIIDDRHTNIKKIFNFSAMLVAGHFVAERDWAESNFGLIAMGSGYQAVRIDPGCSFTDMLFDEEEVLTATFNDLLVKYIGKMNDDGEAYLEDLIEMLHEDNTRKQSYNHDEILRTIKKIGGISRDELMTCMHNSFDQRHYHIADKLIDVLMKRCQKYRSAYAQLKSSRKSTVEIIRSLPPRFQQEKRKIESDEMDTSSPKSSPEPKTKKAGLDFSSSDAESEHKPNKPR